ncbi:MAG: polyprenyl synthetase family protein, partial [Lachnospiraceae bacterium]|nr:polyprenyl synthetase family protein [Lachnospiraceae bacterium]
MEIKEHVMEVEQIILSYMPKEEGYAKTVLSAMNYTMTAGGKRLRPILMLETYRMFGGDQKVIEPFMAAMEMIHTYSLIHDDLPALDNDDYRRGRKTAHIVYGEDMAILAGDALLNYAYETAAKAYDLLKEETSAEK